MLAADPDFDVAEGPFMLIVGFDGGEQAGATFRGVLELPGEEHHVGSRALLESLDHLIGGTGQLVELLTVEIRDGAAPP